MTCTFAAFADEVRRKNLTPKDCGNNHWRILGGASCVNFYPSTKRGPRMYVDGSKAGSRRSVTVADAIAAANAPPPKTKGTKQRQAGTDPHRVQRETPKQDARSDETRNKGDAMKADELQSILNGVAEAITNAHVLIGQGPARDKVFDNLGAAHVKELDDLWRMLNKHRLEMVAGEADSSCRTCGATLQFYDGAICLKCQEKARQAAETARSEAPTLVDVGDLATRRDLERIENRLKEIEWRADETRGAYVAHMKYVHRETSMLGDAG